MTVVQADGNDVVPVTVDEFRISVAETYDVIVQPTTDRAYTIFAQAEDRTGYACGTLAPRAGMAAAIPPMDPRPMRTMADMGMEKYGTRNADENDHAGDGSRRDARHGARRAKYARHGAEPRGQKNFEGSVGVDNVAMMPTERLRSAGEGFPPGRRVLKLCRFTRNKARQRSASALARDHTASDRQYGALHLGL